MDSSLHPSNNVRTLQTIAGANPFHAGLLDLPDHQSAAYQPSSAVQPDASIVMSPFPLPAPTVAHVAKSNSWAVKEAWAKHQGVVEQLYLHEKKPLAEVMRFMETEHGFKATLKMYKTYITKRGLDKKNKEPEMRAIVRKYKQREAQGKGSTIRVRKQQRNFADVVHYWERKGVSIDDIIARQTASPTPEAVKISTPVSSPIATPPELAMPEHMLRCIRDYFKSSFESGTWVRTEPESRCYSLKDENGAGSMWADFVNDCKLAFILFDRNLSHEAGQTLISTTANIKKMLATEYPETLIQLYRLVIDIRRAQKGDKIALSILRQFSAMGQVVLGSQHPLTRFCEWSLSVYASAFHDTVTKCMELMADEFASSVGRTHLSTLVFRMHLIVTMSTDSRARIQKLQKLLAECGQTLRPGDYRVLLVRGFMADECFLEDRYDEAMTLSQKNIDYSRDPSSMSTGTYDYSRDLYILGCCQYATGEVDLGIATLCQAIDLCISNWGPRDSEARFWLLNLEDWYSDQGLWDSAAQAREMSLEILESTDTD